MKILISGKPKALFCHHYKTTYKQKKDSSVNIKNSFWFNGKYFER